MSHGAAWSLLYIGAARLGSFGLSVLVARLLGPDLAGAFGIALAVTALAAFVGVLNVNQALAKRLAETPSPARQRRAIEVAFGFVVCGTLVTGGLLMALAPWVASAVYGDPSLTTTLFWCGPLSIATGFLIAVEGMLQGLHLFRRMARWGGVTAAADLVLSGLAGLAGLPALLAARVVVRLGAVAAVLSAIPPRGGDGDTEREPAGAIIRGLVRFGGPAFLASALVVLGQNLVRLLLVRGSGLAAAGQFQVADTLGQALLFVPTAAAIAFFPAVARDRAAGSPRLADSTGRAVRRVTGFNLPLCLVAIALGPLAVRLIFGGIYRDAGTTLQWLAFAYAMAGLNSIAGPVLLGRGEVGTTILLNLLWLAVLTTAMLAGGARAGAVGAAASIGIAYGVQLLACVLVALRHWGTAPRVAAAPFAATVVLPGLALLASHLRPDWTPLIAAALLVAAGVVFVRWAGPEFEGLLARVRGQAPA